MDHCNLCYGVQDDVFILIIKRCFKVFTHKKIVASSFKKKENMDIYVFKNNIVAKLIQGR